MAGDPSSEQAIVHLLTKNVVQKMWTATDAVARHPGSATGSRRGAVSPGPLSPGAAGGPRTMLELPENDSVHSSRVSVRGDIDRSMASVDMATTNRSCCGCLPLPWRAKGAARELSEDEMPNRDLDEGKNLPNDYEPLDKALQGTPVQEIDPNRADHKTFLVISKRMGRNTIYRFSAASSCFLLAPLNPIRRLMLFISTNQWFDALVITFILVNCVFLALPNEYEIAEYIFQVRLNSHLGSRYQPFHCPYILFLVIACHMSARFRSFFSCRIFRGFIR